MRRAPRFVIRALVAATAVAAVGLTVSAVAAPAPSAVAHTVQAQDIGWSLTVKLSNDIGWSLGATNTLADAQPNDIGWSR